MPQDNADIMLVQNLFQQWKQQQPGQKSKVQVSRLTGDASSRRYYRVTSPEETWVACLDRPLNIESEEKNLFFESQKIFANAGVRVPQVYHFRPQSGLLIEEDLGDKTLLNILGQIKNLSEEKQWYQKSLDELFKIQSLKTQDHPQASFHENPFDENFFLKELLFAKEHFLQKFLNAELTDQHDEKLRKGLQELCYELSQHEMLLVHRDFHSRNIMIKKDEVVIIDFQDGRLGLPQYDLASLLEDAYYEVHPDNKEALKKYYFEKFYSPTFPNKSWEEFENYYYLVAIQRLLKALGTFSYIFHLREDFRYLKFIGKTFESLRSHLLRFSKFDPLRSILSHYYYEH